MVPPLLLAPLGGYSKPYTLSVARATLRAISGAPGETYSQVFLFQPLCSKASFGRGVYCLAPPGSSLEVHRLPTTPLQRVASIRLSNRYCHQFVIYTIYAEGLSRLWAGITGTFIKSV